MSSLHDKMYNHEVKPPANAWEKIAAALDESEIENEFPGRLQNHEVSPPANTWEKITAALDEHEYPARIYNMEVTPPASAWEKINSSLSPAAETVAPVRKLNPFLRYAAAAVFIGLVAYGIIYMTIGNNSKDNNTAAVAVAKDSNTSSKIVTADASKQTQVTTVIAKEDDTLEKSKTLIARLDRSLKRVTKTVASTPNSKRTDEEAIDANLSQSIYAYAAHVPDISERYVMLMTPDGNIIRMSKKWSELLCCVSGEDQDAGCKDQLKKWQEKMAASSLAPSPGNFMDILGLVNSLDENNGL